MEQKRYFKLQEYRDKGLVKPDGITIINGGRNIGKTTGTFFDWLINGHPIHGMPSPTNQVCYIRNSEKEIKKFIGKFNAKFEDELHLYKMTETVIYKLKPTEIFNKKNKETEIVYTKDEIIGFVMTCGNYGIDGERSGIFDNVKFIFCEEYNQIGNSINADKFLTLWTTIKRENKNIETVIIGNREELTADLIIKSRINFTPILEGDYKGDYIYYFGHEEYKESFIFIDLDDSEFTNGTTNTSWRALGNIFGGSMKAYYNRGYKSYDNLDCKNYTEEELARIPFEYNIRTPDGLFSFAKLHNTLIVKQYNPMDNDYTLPSTTFSIEMLKEMNDISLEDNIDYLYAEIFDYMVNKKAIYNLPSSKELVKKWLIPQLFKLKSKSKTITI